MWWIPLIAVGITTVVNLLLAFGGYLGRRTDSTSTLAVQIAQEMLRTDLTTRSQDERSQRIEAEIALQRNHLHDLAEKFSQVLVRIAVLEAMRGGHGDAV